MALQVNREMTWTELKTLQISKSLVLLALRAKQPQINALSGWGVGSTTSGGGAAILEDVTQWTGTGSSDANKPLVSDHRPIVRFTVFNISLCCIMYLVSCGKLLLYTILPIFCVAIYRYFILFSRIRYIVTVHYSFQYAIAAVCYNDMHSIYHYSALFLVVLCIIVIVYYFIKFDISLLYNVVRHIVVRYMTTVCCSYFTQFVLGYIDNCPCAVSHPKC
jgi:hypothetical protein